jgi:hypothetical protein
VPGTIQTVLHLALAGPGLAVDPHQEFGELQALPAALAATAPICDAFHVALLGGSSLRVQSDPGWDVTHPQRSDKSGRMGRMDPVCSVNFSTCVETLEFSTIENMREKRFWNPKQAADHLSVAVQTLYAYCREPGSGGTTKLIGPPPPFRRFGRNCLRFPITEFIKWAETWDQPGEKKDV